MSKQRTEAEIKQEEAVIQIMKLLKENNLTISIDHQITFVPLKPLKGVGNNERK